MFVLFKWYDFNIAWNDDSVCDSVWSRDYHTDTGVRYVVREPDSFHWLSLPDPGMTLRHLFCSWNKQKTDTTTLVRTAKSRFNRFLCKIREERSKNQFDCPFFLLKCEFSVNGLQLRTVASWTETNPLDAVASLTKWTYLATWGNKEKKFRTWE